VPLDTLLSNPAAYLVPPRTALAEYPALVVDAADEAELAHGRSIVGALADGTIAMAYRVDERLVAIVRADDGRLKPDKVFL
jgi:hypothetical protein